MALQARELFTSNAGPGSQKRIAPSVLKSKEFALGSGTLLAGTMVAFETVIGHWVPWDSAGANGAEILKGILWPDDLVLAAADESLGMVLLEGRVHRDDIELNGQTQGNVDTELQTVARDLGIHVEGLVDVR